MKAFHTLLFSTALSTANALAAAPDSTVEEAFNRLDTERLAVLQSELNDSYGRAYAGYRLAIARHLRDEGGAGEALGQVLKLLEVNEAAQTDSNRAALLAMAYGYKIALTPLSAVRYGPKSHSMVERALALDAENPLAQLARGISQFNTPGAFGGDKREALEAFGRAVSLYHAGRGGTTADWGLAEALVWRGLTQRELDREREATQSWRDALAARPDHRWAGALLEGNER
ncbi:hypothetical protein [Microbulbifer taiwanensis]|uniref:Tetratricopeptide repeat protein n=1 Tax=Microbulbifer taiwanensis TaxID=986746 RepID=A0ABW1YRP8_9GAMM|nr:hypothetical protein [Microbulbifer taiwanensis]